MRSLLPFQLVASDLDGTLLNGQHVVGDFTIDTLRKLEQKQVDIVVATGENTNVFSIVAKIGIENIRMITSNGARIHDLSGRLLYKNDLPTDLALEIMNVPFDKNKILSTPIRTAVGSSIAKCHKWQNIIKIPASAIRLSIFVITMHKAPKKSFYCTLSTGFARTRATSSPNLRRSHRDCLCLAQLPRNYE